MARESLITQAGLDKLKQEVEYLTTEKRREVAARIKEAREFGDISENSEYDDAKNEQALLEQRISQLEERVRRATVIDESEVDTEVVSVGTLVHVKDQKSGDSKKFQARRLGRGRSRREQALQRVAHRPRPPRPQAGRDRQRRRAPRAEEEAQDHEDRGRLAASVYAEL